MSKYKVLKETTEWKTPTPNHTYFVSGTNIVGYIKEGTTEPIMFKKPMRFDKRRRTFKELKL